VDRDNERVAIELSRRAFEELVADALDEIPAEFTSTMDNVVVLVEDSNPEEPGLLGLYQGVALTERTSDYGGVLPDTITIYQRPIQSSCDTEADVVREVAVTVVHEIGHHFGMDEDALHDLGWG
jgi:predicted Zn-dependent protease with MMP-like domain